jgi:hypothetical protein
MNRVVAMLLLFCAGSASASDGVAQGVIRLAAVMNETALACKHMSSDEVQAAKAKQKDAAIADMEIAAADYDKMYDASSQAFKAQWASLPNARQAAVCEQMKQAK